MQHAITQSLAAVSHARQHARLLPVLHQHLIALKRYQAHRLRMTYADLQADARFAPAVDFFVTDLYSDRDFSRRDADLERIVPAIASLFPAEALATVDTALRLHAMSETLDLAMAEHFHSASSPPSGNAQWTAARYRQAWRAVGRASEREQQLSLVLHVGKALDKLVKVPLIGITLKAMRGPAAVASLSELHTFLMRGFTAFKALKGADDFLQTIEKRESQLLQMLFASTSEALDHLPEPPELPDPPLAD
jgi:hypothetical protein